jgi:hypothetical protein
LIFVVGECRAGDEKANADHNEKFSDGEAGAHKVLDIRRNSIFVQQSFAPRQQLLSSSYV